MGSPDPQIRWTFNGQPLGETNRLALEADNTELRGEHVKLVETGEYRCIADNGLGTKEASAYVKVISASGPPRLFFEPYDMEAFQGTTIELPCKSEGDDSVEVKWKKDGRTLTSIGRVRIASSGSLFISNLTLADSGRYECSLINQYGRATGSGLITVKYV